MQSEDDEPDPFPDSEDEEDIVAKKPFDSFDPKALVRTSQSRATAEATVMAALETLGSDDYNKVSDIAIGEDPTEEKVEVGPELVEWCGFIRLILFVKKECTADVLGSDGGVVTLEAPCGRKRSVHTQVTFALEPVTPTAAPSE